MFFKWNQKKRECRIVWGLQAATLQRVGQFANGLPWLSTAAEFMCVQWSVSLMLTNAMRVKSHVGQVAGFTFLKKTAVGRANHCGNTALQLRTLVSAQIKCKKQPKQEAYDTSVKCESQKETRRGTNPKAVNPVRKPLQTYRELIWIAWYPSYRCFHCAYRLAL